MIDIRPLSSTDLERIVQLEKLYLGDTIGKEMLSEELNNPFASFFVATKDDFVIGYIGGWIIIDQAEIINFVIDKSYWHQGYGQAIYHRFEEEAQKRNAKQITLEVKENNNRAIDFYSKLGFKPISVRKHYYHDGEDAIVMMKVLYENSIN